MPPPDDPDVEAIAEAIADGAPVDWPAAHESTGTRNPSAPLRQLQIIQAIAAAHRRPLDGHASGASLGSVLAAAPVPSAAAATTAGERWGPLIVHERVGGGSFGDVYRAWDPVLDHEVALKRLRIPAGTPRSKVAAVVHEGQMLAKVRHENVITVHGALEFGGEVGIWMDFVRGRTLEQIVTDDGPMSGDEATVMGEHLCRALAAVHRADLLHRDIKAANVMREAGGRIVMLDFGAGAEITTEGGAAGMVGTPLYMAPELFEGGAATKRSDIYSLGVLLFHLVTGRYPVEGKSLLDIRRAHEEGRVQQLSELRADLPVRFVHVVEQALSKDPYQRYAAAGGMLHQLMDDGHEGSLAAFGSISMLAWLGVGAAALVALPFLAGVFTSVAFNMAIGWTGGLSNESFGAYWMLGFSALLTPSIYMAGTVLVARVALATCRRGVWVATRVLPKTWADTTRQRCGRISRAVRSGDPAAMADMVAVSQVLMIAALCWVFADFIAAVSARLAESPPEMFNALQPNGMKRHYFRFSFSVTALAMVMAWVGIIRGARTRPNRWTVTIGLALIALDMALLILPYRITWRNKLERVEYAGSRCYVTAQQQQRILLYCPDAPKARVRIVRDDDRGITRLNTFESIFSAPQ